MQKPGLSKKARIKEWLKRYLPAEILSILITLAAAGLVFQVTHNPIKTALAGTWGGNIAYFGYILGADIRQTYRARLIINQPYSLKHFYKNLRALVVEFGVAEVADSFFIRPLLMYYFPLWLGNMSLGILVAKFAADITFYIPAIIGYEISKKRLRNLH